MSFCGLYLWVEKKNEPALFLLHLPECFMYYFLMMSIILFNVNYNQQEIEQMQSVILFKPSSTPPEDQRSDMMNYNFLLEIKSWIHTVTPLL